MFWPFNKKGGSAVEEKSEIAVAVAVETKAAVKCPPFGARVGNLTRFGTTWIDLDQVVAIDFEPSDGCGAECCFKNQSDDWHMSAADGLALQTYLESFDQIANQVDAAAR